MQKQKPSSSQPLTASLLPLLILVLVLAAASFHRVGLYQAQPGYDPRSDEGLFYTEAAFQYRYARMIALHQPVPRHDRKAQWPEGLYPHRDLTMLQKYLHGFGFRFFSAFFPEVPFHVFLIGFVSIFSTLSVAALFFGARILGADSWTALLGASLYAFIPAAFGRTQFYQLESTAFPLLAGSFVLMLYSMKPDSPRRLAGAAAAGILLSAALMTWHFTRFYWLAITAVYALAFLFTGADRSRFQVFGVLFGLVLITGLLSPAMRAAGLIVSPPVIVGGVLLLGLYLNQYRPLSIRQRAALLAAGVVLALWIAPAAGEGEVYGHVWALLKYKLANFMIKPDDPGALPLAARILWIGPFNTMALPDLIYGYGLVLPAAVLGGLKLAGRIRADKDFDSMFLLMTAVFFFILNIMIRRLTIFGAFFLGLTMVCLFIGCRGKKTMTPDGGVTPASLPVTGPASISPASAPAGRYLLSLLVLAGCLVFQVAEAHRPDKTRFVSLLTGIFPDQPRARIPMPFYAELNLLDWVRNHTAEEAVFLTNHEYSPTLLTWADRAIVLHPKFESEKMRRKHTDVLLTVYGNDEDAFYRLLQKYQVDYYVYPVKNLLQVGPDSDRYQAGLTRVPRRSLVYRLHFDPDGFSGLRLVYRNIFYQVYQVVKPEESRPAAYRPYYPVYDEALFRTLPGEDDGYKNDYFDDARAEHVLNRIAHAYNMVGRAEQQAALGKSRRVEDLVGEAVEYGLTDGILCYRAAQAVLEAGAPRKALSLIRQALVYDPENMEFQKELARVYLMINDLDSALPLLKALRRKVSDDPEVHNYLGVLYLRKNQYAFARTCFERALDLDPDYEAARSNLSLLNNLW